MDFSKKLKGRLCRLLLWQVCLLDMGNYLSVEIVMERTLETSNWGMMVFLRFFQCLGWSQDFLYARWKLSHRAACIPAPNIQVFASGALFFPINPWILVSQLMLGRSGLLSLVCLPINPRSVAGRWYPASSAWMVSSFLPKSSCSWLPTLTYSPELAFLFCENYM